FPPFRRPRSPPRSWIGSWEPAVSDGWSGTGRSSTGGVRAGGAGPAVRGAGSEAGDAEPPSRARRADRADRGRGPPGAVGRASRSVGHDGPWPHDALVALRRSDLGSGAYGASVRLPVPLGDLRAEGEARVRVLRPSDPPRRPADRADRPALRPEDGRASRERDLRRARRDAVGLVVGEARDRRAGRVAGCERGRVAVAARRVAVGTRGPARRRRRPIRTCSAGPATGRASTGRRSPRPAPSAPARTGPVRTARSAQVSGRSRRA